MTLVGRSCSRTQFRYVAHRTVASPRSRHLIPKPMRHAYLLTLFFAVLGCGSQDNTAALASTDEISATVEAERSGVPRDITAEGQYLAVPSDAQAKFYILEKGGSASNPTIVTKRIGTTFTSFARREYDCAGRLVRYLGFGDTREQMNAASPPGDWGPITDGAIADYVGRAACGRP